MSFSLPGKVAALTGAGSGIGRALALALARKGTALALADRDWDALAQTARDARAAGAQVSEHVLDVAQQPQVDAFARDAAERHGAVQVLINNAGISIVGSFDELTAAEIAGVMDVNFWGVVYGCKAFVPLLRAQPAACIVNVSSVFGLWAPPGQSAYAASKFAVRGFSESLRAELAGSGVRVITVHPGGIKTAIARRARVAAAADAATAARVTRTFDRRLLVTPPEVPAAAIVAAIERGRERVLVGSGARRIELLVRLFPVRAARWLARASR